MERIEVLTADAATHGDRVRSRLLDALHRSLNASLRSAADASFAGNLRRIRGALQSGALDQALRQLDRLWRCRDDQAATLVPIYARLLMLQAQDHAAALGLLQRSAAAAADPDNAALIALAFWHLQRPDESRVEIGNALANYAVTADGLLASVAGALMQLIGAPGWIGRDADLALVGELAQGETSNVLDIRLDGQAAFTQLLRPESRAGRRAFNFHSSQLPPASAIEVSIRDAALLGSGARIAPDFHLDGRCDGDRRALRGWVRLGWLPTRRPRLRIEDQHGHHRIARTGRTAGSGWRWPFVLDRRALRLAGECLHLSAQLPDGRWHALPDTPLLLDAMLHTDAHRPLRLATWSPRRSRPGSAARRPLTRRALDVIIPVYRGREHSLDCIDSVLATIDRGARVVVVDDASDDATLAAALDDLAAAGRITLLRNTENQGFVASVNRAMALDVTRDVVLLNADTQVFDDWLPRLRAAAYSARSVGTVTPWSNDGSIASYPQPGGAAIDPEDGAALHALAAATHSGQRSAIPVGVGFCLYIRRDCLDALGTFDAAVFGKGYGEETDFCLRARRRGWSHLLAADVFVYHAGGVSFGARRAALLDRSQRLINRRHPGYDRFIAGFLRLDPLRNARRLLDERRLQAFDGRFVLLVTLKLAGGVDRHVGERCRLARSQGLFPLVLRPAAAGEAGRCELWTDAIDAPNLVYDIPTSLPALTALLQSLALETIEIQHFLHLDARVIDAVRRLGAPYDVVVHDYAWICPRVTLIDGSGRYCGEPAVSVCRSCVRRHGSNLGEAISVPALRARSAAWLAGARRVVAPSGDTATRLQRHFAQLQVEVQPHTSPIVPSASPPRRRASASAVSRVALIGAIGEHKGHRLLLACARDAQARRLPLEFTVIGYTEDDDALLATGKVFISGRYTDGEVPHLLRREQPDLIWLPSVWPETWSYALDHALASGLPVAAFDLGAIAERLRAAGIGSLMSLDLEPRAINDQLLKVLTPPAVPGEGAVAASGDTLITRPPRHADVAVAAQESGQPLMPSSSDAKSVQDTQAEGMSASVQLLPLPAGLYLFTVKSAQPLSARTSGQLSLPAVHVGLGPGIRPDQVEFIAGPSSHGAWLFATGDVLVMRLNGAGATLIMTSVRAPGGDVLAIKVERLDARTEPVAASAPAPIDPRPPAPAAIKATGKSTRHAAGHAAAKIDLAPSKPPAAPEPSPDLPLPLKIQTHIRSRGDLSFTDAPWAGRVAPGLWLESFSVRPLARFEAQDIEYKGLTGSGFETPWVSDERMCGTRGMAVPLVGFAVRLKPSAAASAFDCEYSGYFKSGVTVGPLRNGAPCRSTVANDPLEGIQIRLVRRKLAQVPAVAPKDNVTHKVDSTRKANGSHKVSAARKTNGTHKVGGARKSAAARRKTVARGAPQRTPRAPRTAPALPARHRGARLTRRHPPRRP